MWALIKKEIRHYFSHPMGYLILGGYLVLSSLFLWFFDTSYNLLNQGFLDFSPIFELTPFLFLFLIPAIGMQSFSEEKALGTIELLLTKPVGHYKLILSKFLGVFSLFSLSLLPIALHAFAMDYLIADHESIDSGQLLTGLLAILFLGSIFSAISIVSSLLFQNQVSAFLSGLFLCFIQYFGWGFLANISYSNFGFTVFSALGIESHYKAMYRGITSLEDLIYFIGLLLILLFFGISISKKQQE